MRLHAEGNPTARYIEVRLDGELQHYVFEVDTDEGYIKTYGITDSQGILQLTDSDGELTETVRRGKIELSLMADAPSWAREMFDLLRANT